MRPLLFSFVTVFILSCSTMDSQYLQGTWHSNESKTLESMRTTLGVSEEAQAIFEDDFFGNLTLNFDSGTYTSESKSHKPDVYEYKDKGKYRILKESARHIVLESYESELKEWTKRTAYKDGNCYYVIISEWGFKEYFCREK